MVIIVIMVITVIIHQTRGQNHYLCDYSNYSDYGDQSDYPSHQGRITFPVITVIILVKVIKVIIHHTRAESASY